jgi:hypothetical protein
LRNSLGENKLLLTDENGCYLEPYVEKIYQVLEPHLKGLHYHPSERYIKIEADLQGRLEHDLGEALMEYKPRQVVRLVRLLAIRGFFLVDYGKFPTYQEAAEEAHRLIPEHTHLSPRDNEPEGEQSQGQIPTSKVSHGLETDNDAASAEPLALYRSKSNVLADPIHPEIGRYATVAIPETRVFYLPYAAQHKILCSLQASLEQVCFGYIHREDLEILEETQKRWEIDSLHALELNQYIYLLSKRKELESRSGRSRSAQDLYESLIALRHHTVHRARVNIQALRRWISDASISAAVLGDSTAAARFAPLGKYLTTQLHRVEADKREAEDRLLATVKDLAAKRAELDRVEQEAMNKYHEEHKQFSARILAELDEFHASIHVDPCGS